MLDMRILRERVEMGENRGFVTEVAEPAVGRRERGRGTGICDLLPYSSTSSCLEAGLNDDDRSLLPYSTGRLP